MSFHLRLTYSQVMTSWFRSTEEFDVRPAEFAVLALIEANDPISARSIAETLNIALPNVVALIKSLEAREFITRRPAPDDRRRQLLRLTPRGEQLITSAGAAVHAADSKITDLMPPEDVATLGRLLVDLADVMKMAPPDLR